MLLPLLLLPLVLVLVSVLSSAAPTAAFRSPPVYIRRQQQRGGIGSVLRHHRTRARLVPLPISEDEGMLLWVASRIEIGWIERGVGA